MVNFIHWSDAMIQRLSALRHEGLTASEIAPKFSGATRNGVCGIIQHERRGSRLFGPVDPTKAKVAATAHGPKRPEPVRPERMITIRDPMRMLAMAPTPHQMPFVAVALPATRAIPFMSRSEGECRWNDAWDVDAMTFCGAPTMPRKSFCSVHHAMAYAPTRHRPSACMEAR